MPCKIHSNDSANVSSYFTPYIRKIDDERKFINCSVSSAISIQRIVPFSNARTYWELFKSCLYTFLQTFNIYYLDYDSSFRGYPLHGKKITIPSGYKGVTFLERKKPEVENVERNLYSTGTFSSFTYWNYDKLPSKNDALAAAFDWIDIAEAVSYRTVFKGNLLLNNNQDLIVIHFFSYTLQNHSCNHKF